MAGEVWRRSAAEIATLIAHGELSAAEAVEAHIARIAAIDPALNVLTCERFAAAREEARAADATTGLPHGALHGVPVTIKESLDVAGLPTTLGVPSRRAHVAERDGPYVKRLREAGAIVLGKTNVSQLMVFIESDNPLYGRSNNPWNLQRTPGGSSGGQAAIVAAGGSPFGLGTDIGGSIRVPATFCGIAGLKPTAGRYPDRTTPEIFAGETAIRSQTGVLAREVRDIALVLETLGRGGDDELAPAPPLRSPHAVDVKRLRVGAYVEAGSFGVAPAVARAVEEAAGALARAGVAVVPFAPPEPDLSLALFYRILAADGARGASRFLGSDPRDPRVEDLLSIASKSRGSVELIVRALRALGQKGTAGLADMHGFHSAADYWQAVAGQEAYATRFAEALETVEGGPLDALICPACALPALRHGASRALGTAGAYATLYNLLGYPAGVVPFTRVGASEAVGRSRSRDRLENAAYKTELGSEGLPIGVQVVAKPWREDVALALMFRLESAARERPDFPSTPVLGYAPREA
jgi:fatty acid amide hydrolase